MDARNFSDQQLVDAIEAVSTVPRSIVDEYYRRCIPLYLDFIGSYWHTGFYREQDEDISPEDQVRMIDYVVESVKLSPGERLLDVGCGIGTTICHINLKYGCEVVGLTPVPEQQKLANNIALGKDASIRVDLGHAENLPYADASFDVVTCFESPCHFENRQAFFNEVYRVLKPGGRLAGEDWMATDLNNSENRMRWIDPICKTWAIPMLGDASEYRSLMEAANMTDIRVIDMQTLMPLRKGFTVTAADRLALDEEIRRCDNPLLALTLKGLVRLGMALEAGAFTIGYFYAIKPAFETDTTNRNDLGR